MTHDGRRRGSWIVAAAALAAAAAIAGMVADGNAGQWLRGVWASVTAISPVYVGLALALQTLQTILTGEAWYGILRYAYPEGGVTRRAVLACVAAAIALNGFLPANAGTAVKLLMLVATITAATLAGVVAAAAVEKLFFAAIGGLVFLYLFLDVGISARPTVNFASSHPWLTVLVLAGAIVILLLAGKLAWRWLEKLWEQARQGGRILTNPRAYLAGVFVPQLSAWCCRAGVIAVLLAAYRIPVDFQTVIRVVGGNMLGGLVALTPGGVGVNQALNVASLHGTANAEQATAYSIGQQLLTTGWNLVLAGLFLVWAFGWSGAKRLVEQSYRRARVNLTEGLEGATRHTEKQP